MGFVEIAYNEDSHLKITLHELTRQAPTTLEAFAEVKGIGPQKTEQYGELLVTLINNYLQERK